MTAPIPSPCVSVCVIDATANQCIGCYRTLPEIAAWGTMDSQTRDRIMDELDDRMAAAFERADAGESG